jgi:hypothetical protein
VSREGDHDDGDRGEREKRSWREIDRMRDGSRTQSDRTPRGAAAQAGEAAASKQYRKQLDRMFSTDRGGTEGAQLAKAMRDALGTPGLADACRAFRDAVGAPEEASQISLFLDSGDPELVLVGLEALRSGCEDGSLQVTPGFRTQLRMLAQDSNDEVAEAAEELLERP